MSATREHRRITVLAMLVGLVVSGCERPPIDFVEVPRIDERVEKPEWQRFVRIVRALPDEKLLSIGELFQPPPNWQASRTLSIKELVREEQQQIDALSDRSALIKHWAKNKRLQLILARERLTTEQFVGLTMAISMAYSRSTLREEQLPLVDVIRRAVDELDPLQRDQRQFSALSPDEQHQVLKQAVWLNRYDRADKLSQVPLENLELVQANANFLQRCLPENCLPNPLDSIADRQEEQGVPFEETPESGRDDQIRWNESERRLELTDRGSQIRVPRMEARWSKGIRTATEERTTPYGGAPRLK